MEDQALLAAHQVEFGYERHPVLHGVNVELSRGDLVALIGPNGSGKTTLLKLLCGILSPQEGRVAWQSRALAARDRRDLARRIALVPQELNIPFSFTVSEIVGLGRTPHLRVLVGESTRDRQAIARALELTDTQPLSDRYFQDLSGGEQQRVVIAMALAQIEPSGDSGSTVLLLDEPTVHLDINHQIEILELVRTLNRDYGLTVLATMHDLNLASLYFDRLILLDQGRIITQGTPDHVLSREHVEGVFGTGVIVQSHPTRGVPHIILLPSNGNGRHRKL